MRALITGIGGFVGPHLADCLSRAGCECFGTIHNESERTVYLSETAVPKIDVRDRDALADFIAAVEPDYIFHLAAISDLESGRRAPGYTFDVNVGGTVNLLDSVRELGKRPRVLIVSSGAIYGDRDSGERGFSENDPPTPNSAYAVSKHICEQVAKCYYRDHGLDVIVARPFNHTGPGQSPIFVCSSLARQLAESDSQEVVIRTGALYPRRDFTDVRDVVAAYRLLMENGASGETYNVCSGQTVSIGQVLELLATEAHRQVHVEVDSTRIRKNEIERLGGDPTKLRDELGWSSSITLKQTMHDLLEFWRRKARVAA